MRCLGMCALISRVAARAQVPITFVDFELGAGVFTGATPPILAQACARSPSL